MLNDNRSRCILRWERTSKLCLVASRGLCKTHTMLEGISAESFLEQSGNSKKTSDMT